MSLPPPDGLPVVLGHPSLPFAMMQNLIVMPTLCAFRLPHLYREQISYKAELRDLFQVQYVFFWNNGHPGIFLLNKYNFMTALRTISLTVDKDEIQALQYLFEHCAIQKFNEEIVLKALPLVARISDKYDETLTAVQKEKDPKTLKGEI